MAAEVEKEPAFGVDEVDGHVARNKPEPRFRLEDEAVQRIDWQWHSLSIISITLKK